jgi:prepilin-type N-terminal cleavage/methylation domain-containing protein
MPGKVPQLAAGAGFTLIEVVIAMLIISVSLAGLMGVYVQTAVRTEWSAYNLSAEMMAVSGMERCRAAKFDPRGTTPVDLLWGTNFPQRVDILDVGTSVGIAAYGTNVTTITQLATNPPLKMIRVDCTWSFPRRGTFTNTVITYRTANQ